MRKKSVAVLEIGSRYVTCIIGERGVNGTFIIKSVSECEYDGFENGIFYDNGSIADAVAYVLQETSKNARMRITDLFIGVPGEFSTVKTKKHTLAFTRKKRIKNRDINDLFNIFELKTESDFVITDVSAIYFELDDNRHVLNPENYVSCKLGGLLSFMLCKKDFVRLMTNMCKTVGVKNITFISESLAEGLFLFHPEERQYQRILVDIGYLTTNITVIQGGGVLFQKAFSYGGGYITASLMDKLDLPFDIAEKLKRKINLGYETNAEGKYKIAVNDDLYDIPLQKANFIVRFCIDEIGEKINGILDLWQIDYSSNVPLALTGGGLCYMRGAKEILSTRIDMAINTVVPTVPSMNKPDASACLALLDYALAKAEGMKIY